MSLPDGSAAHSYRVYYISPWRRLVLYLLAALMLALAGFALFLAFGDTASDFFLVALGVAVFFLLAVAGLVYLARAVRLVLSPAGVELVNPPAMSLRTTWDNVSALDVQNKVLILAHNPYTHRQDIVRQASVGAMSVFGLNFTTADQVDLLAEGRLVLLEPFWWSWRHGDLQQVLRQYAPHLQTRSGTPQAGHDNGS